MYCLVDTGNRAHSLISKEIFYEIFGQNGELKKEDLILTGAGSEQYLNCLGSTKNPLTLIFHDKERERKHYFSIFPLVIKNLQLDILLSYKDLQQLQAVISTAKNFMEIRNFKGQPLKIPLTEIPSVRKQCAVGKIGQTFTLFPMQEKIFSVKIDSFHLRPNDTVSVEPLESFISKFKCLTVATVDVVRLSESGQKYVHTRLWNVVNTPITIPANAEVATIQSFDRIVATIVENGLQTLQNANAIVCPVETRKNLFENIYELLGFNDIAHDLSIEERKQITNLFVKYRPALALSPEEVGTVKGVEISIPTGDHAPIASKCRPLNSFLREQLKSQVKKWLSQGVIKPCDGPWSSPLVPVPKANGKIRFAIDYRRLNAITTKDARPVANLNEKLASLKSPGKPFKFWATMDLSEAYHCIPIKESDKEKTAMITPIGLYAFNRMSFGLCSAPQCFHQVVTLIENALLARDKDLSKSILSYFDDSIIGAYSVEDLMKKLEHFLIVIQELGLKINPAKCHVGRRHLKWLGHYVSETGISPDKDRVACLDSWPPPTTPTEVRSLYGLFSYFRKFLRNMSSRSYHISELQKQENPVWTKECQQEFEELRENLKKSPLLGHPDFSSSSQPFILTVDTSKYGTGAVLSQKQLNDGKLTEIIISFASKKLTPSERFYSSYKLELRGVVTSVEHYRFYLLGKEFIIRTDNKALAWLMKNHSDNTPALIFRWSQILAAYIFRIEYISAKQMKLVDAISRRGYSANDWGNMSTLVPLREPLWESDPSKEEARNRMDDAFWIPVMKQKGSNLQINAITRSRQALELKEIERGREGKMPGFFNFYELDGEDISVNKNSNSNQVVTLETLLQQKQSEKENFRQILLKAQEESTSISYVRQLLEKQQEFPKKSEEIRKVILQIFEKSKLSKILEKEEILGLILLRNHQKLSWKNEILLLDEKIIVPPQVLSLVILRIHNEGHFGEKKTSKIFKQYFYSPKVDERISAELKKCRFCVDGKRLYRYNPGLGQINQPAPRLAKFYLDTVALPKSTDNFNYLLTCIDAATGWLEAYPMRRATAKNVTTILRDHICSRYGPVLLLTDQGKEFLNKIVNDVVQELKSTLYVSTAYNPNSNLVERAHRDLNAKIRVLLLEQGLPKEGWTQVLGEALWKLRTSPNNHNSTAYERVFAQKAEQAALVNPYNALESFNYHLVKDYADSCQFKVKNPENKQEYERTLKKVGKYFIDSQVFAIEENNSEIAQYFQDKERQQMHQSNKIRHDQKSRIFIPLENELVDLYLETDPESLDNRKLRSTWNGPFIVKNVKSYKADLVPWDEEVKKKMIKDVHFNRLRPSLFYQEKVGQKQTFQTSELQVVKLSEAATLPSKGSELSAGFDLYPMEKVEIAPSEQALVNTGLAIAVPYGCYGRIAPRSSLALKSLLVHGGVIDADYTGEVKIILQNLGKNKVTLTPKLACAQLILERNCQPKCTEKQKLAITTRGQNGFGSTDF